MRPRIIVDNLIFVIIIILMSGASVLSSSDTALISIFVFLSLLMYLRKRTIDKFIFIILLWWIIINAISSQYNRTGLNMPLFIGYIVWFMIPYFAIKIIDRSFWQKLENWIYVLTLIAIPIFLLNVAFPSFFRSLYSLFEPFTDSIFHQKDSQATYWYGFIYTHSGNDILRNCGFVWEPGAYAMILIIMIIYIWCREGVRLTKHVIVYLIALITTFSTIGYLSLIPLLIIYIIYAIKTKKILHILALLFIFLGYWSSVSKLDFLFPKIDRFIYESNNEVVYQQEYKNRYEANRILSFFYDFKKSLKLPTGYGIVEDSTTFNKLDKIVGVNGLGKILVIWGIPGLFLVIISTYNFLSGMSLLRLNVFEVFLMILAVLMVFFSNPIERNPILFLVLFTPYIFRIKHTISKSILIRELKPDVIK